MAVRTVAGERLWGRQPGEQVRATLPRLGYSGEGKRDLRLDFLRGLAVSVMVVDHIGGDTLLTNLTGGNRFIVSAAEAFVFLSGLIVGIVYGDRVRRAGMAEAARGLLRRAATLYKASVGMALAFLALLWWTEVRLWLDRSSYASVGDPIERVIGIATLQSAFHGSDVLVMYTVMLVVAPAIIYLLYRGRTPLVLLGSFALWALYQRFPEVATIPWAVGDSAFQVAAWQLLFVFGMATGFHRQRVEAWLLGGGLRTRVILLSAASLVYFLARGSEVYGATPLPVDWFGDASYGAIFAKANLGPGRVMAFLAVAVLAYSLANALWVPLSRALGWFLVPLGQNSLYVYLMHLFVLVLLYNLAPLVYYWLSADQINLAAQLAGLALVWFMVRSRFLFRLVPR